MVNLLTVLALLGMFGSWLFVSQATVGVAGIASACVLGIVARIIQSERQHRELRESVRKVAAPAV